MLLQRVVDPELKSRGIEDSGIADVFNRPILIALQVLPPIVIVNMGTYGSRIVTGVCFACVAVMWIFAYSTKGWVPRRPIKTY